MNILDLTKKGEGDCIIGTKTFSTIFTTIEDEYFIQKKMKWVEYDCKIVFNYLRAILWGNYRIDKIIATYDKIAYYAGRIVGKDIDYRVVCNVLSALDMMGIINLEFNEDGTLSITKLIDREDCFSNLFSNLSEGN